MPLVAYFRNVGAVLFALLLIVDFYLPAPRAADRAPANSPDIHIRSQQKLPAPVVFDTTQVALAAVKAAPWDSNPPAPPVAREMSATARNAFAQSERPDAQRTASVEQKKRQAARRYAARRHAQPQFVMASPQGQFGWFGFRSW
jgi:hypothetical protein